MIKKLKVLSKDIGYRNVRGTDVHRNPSVPYYVENYIHNKKEYDSLRQSQAWYVFDRDEKAVKQLSQEIEKTEKDLNKDITETENYYAEQVEKLLTIFNETENKEIFNFIENNVSINYISGPHDIFGKGETTCNEIELVIYPYQLDDRENNKVRIPISVEILARSEALTETIKPLLLKNASYSSFGKNKEFYSFMKNLDYELQDIAKGKEMEK